jgi:hypothetical protein
MELARLTLLMFVLLLDLLQTGLFTGEHFLEPVRLGHQEMYQAILEI